eukprot:6197733-Pleurochrysis_carterae.AAC.1
MCVLEQACNAVGGRACFVGSVYGEGVGVTNSGEPAQPEFCVPNIVYRIQEECLCTEFCSIQPEFCA